MNYKLLFTVATLSLSTLAASDASEAARDNSHMGAEGYFEGCPMSPRTIDGKEYTLSSTTALTQHVPFTARRRATHHVFKACLEDPANKNIFNNAQAFGILIDHPILIYVILNNNKTYCFISTQTDTAPVYNTREQGRYIVYGCNAINNGDIRHISGYTSNQRLIQQVFNSIRDTGKIAEHLHNDLNAPTTTERAEHLAAAAHAVVATRADSGMSAGAGAPAGAGSGFVTTASTAVDPRDAEIRALRAENTKLKELVAQYNWVLGTVYEKPGMNPTQVAQIIAETLSVAPRFTNMSDEESKLLLTRALAPKIDAATPGLES
jgi:hypothetical protein